MISNSLKWKNPDLYLQAKGGSGGGGGGTGVVDYPTYMKDWHGDALDGGAVDTLTHSVTDAINSAYGNSPYSGESAYDPSDEISEIRAAITAFDTAIDTITGDTEIEAEVEAYTDIRDDELTDVILPRFKGGMRDVNAVMTSAFVIGEAVLEAYSARDVAKFESKLRLELRKLEAEMNKQLLHYTVDANRIIIVAGKEEADANLDIDSKDAVWDLELFQYGANVLGSIGGGTVDTKGVESKHSTLGGALSGAAAGAMMGSEIAPGYGTAIGAGLGAIIGAFG